jgi:ABC-type lipoprotein release transport system permease subunit
VIAILKSGNPFMSFAIFSHLNDLKPLLDFQEHETAFFSVMIERLKNPRVVIEQADQLHKALVPNIAGYKGTLLGNRQTREVQALSVLPEEEARDRFTSQLHITAGNVEETLKDEQKILLSQSVAEELDVEVGDQVTLAYETRFEDTPISREYQIGALFKTDEVITGDMLFLHAEQMYATFFPSAPRQTVSVDAKSPLFPALIKEWRLLERSPDQKALQKKHRELNNSDWQGTALDVTTMYEAASDVLKLEQVLDVVTMIAVLILFFIILIGVINTLRMTIRERTREIGTVRAIGMRRLDVWLSFITEVWLLTLFASIVGIILAFVAMHLLGLITFQSDESFFMIFLVNKHLHFVPTVGDIVINLVIISIITVLTAFFPALRAARMSAAEALRHYE